MEAHRGFAEAAEGEGPSSSARRRELLGAQVDLVGRSRQRKDSKQWLLMVQAVLRKSKPPLQAAAVAVERRLAAARSQGRLVRGEQPTRAVPQSVSHLR